MSRFMEALESRRMMAIHYYVYEWDGEHTVEEPMSYEWNRDPIDPITGDGEYTMWLNDIPEHSEIRVSIHVTGNFDNDGTETFYYSFSSLQGGSVVVDYNLAEPGTWWEHTFTVASTSEDLLFGVELGGGDSGDEWRPDSLHVSYAVTELTLFTYDTNITEGEDGTVWVARSGDWGVHEPSFTLNYIGGLEGAATEGTDFEDISTGYVYNDWDGWHWDFSTYDDNVPEGPFGWESIKYEITSSATGVVINNPWGITFILYDD